PTTKPPAYIGAYVRVALPGAGAQRVEAEAARYESFPQYAAHFRGMGARAIDTCAVGKGETIQQRLAAYGGVDEVIVRAIAADETVAAYLDVLRSAAP